jgi:Heat shock protein
MKLNAKIYSLLLALIIFSTAAFAQKSDLNGRWNLIELKSNGETIDLNVKSRGDKKPGIDFEEQRFGLITTCNAMGGSYTASDAGDFKAGAIIGTKMFCGEELMKIENAMAQAVEAAVKYSIREGVLTLSDESGENVLKFSREGNSGETDSKEMTLYVASRRVECMTVAPMKCLQTKEKADGKWRLFYDRIEGFEFEEGFYYILKVRRTRIPEPPRDTSGFRWELIEVVKKTRKFAKA